MGRLIITGILRRGLHAVGAVVHQGIEFVGGGDGGRVDQQGGSVIGADDDFLAPVPVQIRAGSIVGGVGVLLTVGADPALGRTEGNPETAVRQDRGFTIGDIYCLDLIEVVRIPFFVEIVCTVADKSDFLPVSQDLKGSIIGLRA